MTVENILNKYSNGGAPKYDFEKGERPFTKLQALETGVKYTIEALFINTKGKYGDQGVIYTQNAIVNLPNHLKKLIEDMRQDGEVTQAINNRELAFEVYEYVTEEGRSGYSINIVQADKQSSEGRAFGNKSDEDLAF